MFSSCQSIIYVRDAVCVDGHAGDCSHRTDANVLEELVELAYNDWRNASTEWGEVKMTLLLWQGGTCQLPRKSPRKGRTARYAFGFDPSSCLQSVKPIFAQIAV